MVEQRTMMPTTRCSEAEFAADPAPWMAQVGDGRSLTIVDAEGCPWMMIFHGADLVSDLGCTHEEATVS